MKKLTITTLVAVSNLLNKTNGENTDSKNVSPTYGTVTTYSTGKKGFSNDPYDIVSTLKKEMTLSGSRAFGIHTQNSDWDFFTTDEAVFNEMKVLVKAEAISQHEQLVGYYEYMGAIEIYKYRLISDNGEVYDIQLSYTDRIMDKNEARLQSVAKKIVKGVRQAELIKQYGNDDLKERWANATEFYATVEKGNDIKYDNKGDIYVDGHIAGICEPTSYKSMGMNLNTLKLLDLIEINASPL